MCETEGETYENEEQSVEDALEEAIETFGETLGGETAFDDEEKMLEETHCLICHLLNYLGILMMIWGREIQRRI